MIPRKVRMQDEGQRQRSRYTAITAATEPIADLSVNPPANTAKYAAGRNLHHGHYNECASSLYARCAREKAV